MMEVFVKLMSIVDSNEMKTKMENVSSREGPCVLNVLFQIRLIFSKNLLFFLN